MLSLAVSAAGQNATSPTDPNHLPQDAGKTGLKNMLRKLSSTARLMQTTAHPDDEDGGMLVYESRAKGAEVMLFTLTRGDGGQNKTGSNLFDELGVLRTLELLASGSYYQAQQRFSHVADFGFSKNPNEAFEKWGGHEVPLSDMVRAIRTFRPDVVASRFQGTSRDGHGHHQAAGILSPEAVRAASDPSRFPEQIREGLFAWQVKKLYMDNVHPGEDYTFQFDAGQNFAPLGMTYAQLGIAGFNHQRSQGAGSFQPPPGPNLKTYKLIDSAPQFASSRGAQIHEQDFFDGIDTSLPGLATKVGDEGPKVPKLAAELSAIDADVKEATRAATKGASQSFVPLARGLAQAKSLIHHIKDSPLLSATKLDLLTSLETKEQQLEIAAGLAAGFELTLNSKQVGVVPGETFVVNVHLHNAGQQPISRLDIALDMPTGWKSVAPEQLGMGSAATNSRRGSTELGSLDDAPTGRADRSVSAMLRKCGPDGTPATSRPCVGERLVMRLSARRGRQGVAWLYAPGIVGATRRLREADRQRLAGVERAHRRRPSGPHQRGQAPTAEPGPRHRRASVQLPVGP